MFVCRFSTRRTFWQAGKVPLYAYEFRDRTAPSYFPDMGFDLLAYHTADIQYLSPATMAATKARRTR